MQFISNDLKKEMISECFLLIMNYIGCLLATCLFFAGLRFKAL